MKKLLTDITIRSLQPQDKQYELFDTTIPGFAIRVSPKGTKTFVLLYRIGGKSKRLSIGRFPTTTLKSARDLASKAVAAIATGTDPLVQKIEARYDYQRVLFSRMTIDFIEKYAKRKNRRWKDTERILQRQFLPHWKHMTIHDITRKDVNKILDHIVTNNGPRSANVAFAIVRKFFNWCIERGEMNNSPCLGMKKPAAEQSRQRVVTEKELVSIWKTLSTFDYPFEPFCKLLILTGQRRTEVASMRWNDLDLENKIWRQPATSNKSDRVHLVPLSTGAVEILQKIPQLDRDFVFPSRSENKTHISGFSNWKEKLDERSKTEGWTFHDLRRSITTTCAKLGVSHLVADLFLNHRGQFLTGVTGVYNQYDYLAEKIDAAEKWWSHINSLTETNESNKSGTADPAIDAII